MREMRLGFPKPTKLILGSMIGLAAIWVIQAILYQVTAFGAGLYEALILRPGAVVGEGHVWSILTYVVVNDISRPWGLLGSVVVLYFFGTGMHEHWGTRRFVSFFLLTTLAGAAAVFLLWIVGLPGAVALGTGSFGAALAVAWGLTFPYREFYLVVFPMKGKHLVWLTVGFTVLSAISVAPSGVAADFGAMAMTALLVSGLWRTNRMKLLWDKLLVALRLRKAPKLYVVPKGPSKYDIQ